MNKFRKLQAKSREAGKPSEKNRIQCNRCKKPFGAVTVEREFNIPGEGKVKKDVIAKGAGLTATRYKKKNGKSIYLCQECEQALAIKASAMYSSGELTIDKDGTPKIHKKKKVKDDNN